MYGGYEGCARVSPGCSILMSKHLKKRLASSVPKSWVIAGVSLAPGGKALMNLRRTGSCSSVCPLCPVTWKWAGSPRGTGTSCPKSSGMVAVSTLWCCGSMAGADGPRWADGSTVASKGGGGGGRWQGRTRFRWERGWRSLFSHGDGVESVVKRGAGECESCGVVEELLVPHEMK